ncbi:MAG: hypothetical protein ABIN67_11760 [Ferruginibacter sp.]
MRINLLLFAMLTSIVLKAQVQKGAIFIGGDLQISSLDYKPTEPVNYNATKNNNYYFSPVLGWAVKENFIVGGRLSASFSKSTQQNNGNDDKSRNLGAGIWMRKYLSLGKFFYFFGDAGLNGYSIYRKQTQGMQPNYYYTEKGFSANASIYPGIAYQIKKCLFVEAALNNLVTLGYTHINLETKNQAGVLSTGNNNSYNLSSSIGNGVPLQVGVRWLIANNKKL